VITIHGSYERAHWRTCFPDLKSKAWYWAHATASWLLADRIVTVSKAAGQELLELRVARPRQLRCVHLAAAPEFLPVAAQSEREVLDAYDVCEPYVLFVGGYDKHKNVETLVTAFDQLDRPDHQLVIVADRQWRYEELHRAWRRLRTFERLRCIQADPRDVPALYRNAEVCVVPSVWDSFGLQLIESMASGTPVLASNMASFREVGGDAILTFDPTSPTELAALLDRVLESSDLRNCLRERGLRRAAAFSWKQTAEDTVEIYREALGHPEHVAP
jgi:alpha-1,3-rhamnosyl/mannosyltransferase